MNAKEERDEECVEVEVFGGRRGQNVALAFGLKDDRGKPLAESRRVAAAVRTIAAYPALSDRRIGSIVGLSDKTVAAIRRRSTDASSPNRVGRDGRVRPVDPAERRLIARRLLEQDPRASLREIAEAAGIAVATARDVRQRMLKGQDVLPARLRRLREGDTVKSGTSRAGDEDRVHGQRTRRTAVNERNPTKNRLPDAAIPALGTLSNDPSLRMSALGRSLLRLLVAHPRSHEDWERMVRAVPTYHLAGIARIARLQAEKWLQFAEMLEFRRRA
ncbi:hypothetical protein [Streptomyces sp. CRB46]|uniref:hypothetical protein n=1 Tax=Streptomyces sp. CRB46 TaxID=2682613 RepID=UPI0018F6D527|nr:hypothetical protein [Streptomyces sp. CRB46]